eukprot:7862132-Pyramimonas_sp.AAC.1
MLRVLLCQQRQGCTQHPRTSLESPTGLLRAGYARNKGNRLLCAKPCVVIATGLFLYSPLPFRPLRLRRVAGCERLGGGTRRSLRGFKGV